MVGHPVDHQPKTAPVALLEESVEAVEVPEERVHVAVVSDVVAEVSHRGWVERCDPDGVHAEGAAEMVELRSDPVEVSDTVTIGVGEAADVDLVHDGPLPPGIG